MIKPKICFKITFKCGHVQRGYRAENEIQKQELESFILDKFEGLCGKCYEKYCKENNKKYWWESMEG